jgi:hypothetical protein
MGYEMHELPKEFWRDDVAYIDCKRFGAHTTPEGRLDVKRCLARFSWRTRHEGIAMDCTRPSCWKHRRGTGKAGSRLYFCLTFRGKVRLFFAIAPENGFDGWGAAAWYKIVWDHIVPLSAQPYRVARCELALSDPHQV